MPKASESAFRKLHAIQLTELNVVELHIRVNESPSSDDEGDKKNFRLATGNSEYDDKNQCIYVGVKLEVGMEENANSPFSMKIELGGLFKVDESRFSRDNIKDWAQRNAPLVLFPYLREHAFALSSRCGFSLILPLIEVPTLVRHEPKDSEQ